MMDLFNVWDVWAKKNYIKIKVDEQIKFAIDWCIKHNMKIHPFYEKQEKTPEYINKVINYAKLFPKKQGVDMSKLLMTDIGLYSITSSSKSTETINIIKKYINNVPTNNLIITESNGGVGGDTIVFANYFKQVNVVEFSPIHCAVLRNNVIDVYKCTNVVLFCTDYTHVFKKIKQDILYMDPPWGGPNYKYVDKLYLHIGNYMIEEIINKIKSNTKIIVIKAPFNYDIDYLKSTVNGKFFIHNVANYQIIVVIF